MMHIFILLIGLPVVVLVGLRVLGFTRSRHKNFVAATAPAGSRISRIAECIVLLCIAGAFYLFTAATTYGIPQNLSLLPHGLARVQIIVAVTALLLLLGCVAITYWRASFGIVLAAIVMAGYGFIPDSGLMERVLPEAMFAPKVEHTFRMSGKFAGGEELWINNVYLGKMPLTITWDEFREKVPFMAEPPEGYKDENSRQPAEPWFQFTFWETKNLGGSRHSYVADNQQYYAKIKFNDQWAESRLGGGGGGGGRWYRQYEYSFGGYFPDREKLIQEDNRRFESLLQKARLSNYTVDSEWWQAYSTFDEGDLWTLRRLAKDEPGFVKVMDAAARLKYGFTAVDRQTAQAVFERICNEADAAMRYDAGGVEGWEMGLIFDMLDVNRLVADYSKALKSGRSLYSSKSGSHEYDEYWTYNHDPKNEFYKPVPASVSVIRHALHLWDKKLDAEQPHRDNLIETEIAPLYIAYRGDVGAAASLGGSLLEEYLLRQFHREPRLKGMGLDYEDREYTEGQYVNKWIYHLVQLDTPAGKEFRQKHSDITLQMAKLMTTSMHNHEKSPPEFVFSDLERGQKSLAVQYWPELSAAIDSSFPSREESKLQKRFQYLARMGDLATDQMYIDCWEKINLDQIDYPSQLIGILREIPRQRLLPLARYILNDLNKRNDQIRYEQEWFIEEFENYLICLGDDTATTAFLSSEPKEKQNRLDRIRSIIDQYVSQRDREDVAAYFAEQNDADLKILGIHYLRETPAPERVALLKTLAQDTDAAVRQAAERALNELEAIRQIPYELLVSLASTSVLPQ
ncbi:MAG: hypothetical protein GXY41_02835 [Phycisphaerae bacterium]|nr:hypothetical protein [Phycisphaerae bacterium]